MRSISFCGLLADASFCSFLVSASLTGSRGGTAVLLQFPRQGAPWSAGLAGPAGFRARKTLTVQLTVVQKKKKKNRLRNLPKQVHDYFDQQALEHPAELYESPSS
jgi:hypothetical protein